MMRTIEQLTKEMDADTIASTSPSGRCGREHIFFSRAFHIPNCLVYPTVVSVVSCHWRIGTVGCVFCVVYYRASFLKLCSVLFLVVQLCHICQPRSLAREHEELPSKNLKILDS